MEYTLREIKRQQAFALAQLVTLLEQEQITLDRNLDYSVGLYDHDGQLIATGSCFTNTLRCLAVDKAHQGEGLLDQILSHLIQYQADRGYSHLFIYTKTQTAPLFTGLGFFELAQIDGKLSFLENRRHGFQSYLRQLEAGRKEGRCAALVMNCNPFTLGHLYLIEQAAAQNDWLHLFLVSEDVSFFPFADRLRLVQEGCKHLNNISFHQTGDYMISNAVFPSYFLQDEDTVIQTHAKLDITLFLHIAKALNIQRRYVGEEPFSKVTGIYNAIMSETLAQAGMECIVIKRKTAGDQVISASTVRRLVQAGRLEEILAFVPRTTYDYFATPEGKAVIARLQAAQSVVHY